MTALSRRDLLAIAGWTLLAQPPLHFTSTPDDLAAWLKQHADGENLASLAAAYRQKYPDESADQLRVNVLSGKRAGESLPVLLSRKVREDFSEERLVVLDGWVLSATEGRLIALTIDY